MVISVSLLSFLVLSTSFKTAMVSSFTKRRYEHQISSLEDIVNLNLKCYATEEIKSSYGMSEDYLSGYVANCTTIHKKNKEDILKEIALKRSAAMTCRGFEFKFMLEKLYLMGYEKRLIALVPKKVIE
jgi:subtilase family serine protease